MDLVRLHALVWQAVVYEPNCSAAMVGVQEVVVSENEANKIQSINLFCPIASTAEEC